METTEYSLLDTHVWLWLMDGDPRLNHQLVQDLERASVESRLAICGISIWEVVALECAGRVSFAMPVDRWLDEALSTPGLSVIPIDQSVAIESERLPGGFAGDVPDRVIVASTRLTGGTLVTADPRIIAYGADGFVRVAAAL